MFHLNPGAWLIGREDPDEDRNRMHRIALHEARIATDYHQSRTADIALAESHKRARLRPAASSRSGTNLDLAACCA
jgi:hypothetical protein